MYIIKRLYEIDFDRKSRDYIVINHLTFSILFTFYLFVFILFTIFFTIINQFFEIIEQLVLIKKKRNLSTFFEIKQVRQIFFFFAAKQLLFSKQIFFEMNFFFQTFLIQSIQLLKFQGTKKNSQI